MFYIYIAWYLVKIGFSASRMNLNWCCYFYIYILMNFINESYFMIKFTVYYSNCLQFIRPWKRVTFSVFDRLCQLLLSGCCRLRRCLPNRTAQWRVWTRTVRNPRPPSKACGRRPSRVSRAPQTLSWWVGDLNTIFLNVKYLSQLPHTGQNL